MDIIKVLEQVKLDKYIDENPEGTVIKQNHNFLKLMSFVLGYIFLLGISMLSVYGVNDETPLYREVLQGTLAELGVCAIIALYLCVIRKKLAAAAVYKLSYSNKKVITGLFLACPLVVFLYANIVNVNFSNIFQAVEKTSWLELAQNLLFVPLAAILGPVFEEFCCRVMCISVFKSKTGKIIAFILTTVLFAFCHGSDFASHIPGGLIFGIVFLVSENIMLTIVLHMAWNTATFIVPDLSQAVALLMPQKVKGIWGSPIIAVVILVLAFIIGVIMLMKNFNKEKEG